MATIIFILIVDFYVGNQQTFATYEIVSKLFFNSMLRTILATQHRLHETRPIVHPVFETKLFRIPNPLAMHVMPQQQ